MSIFNSRIQWKNDPPPKNQAYRPTQIEHLANIITHGVSFTLKSDFLLANFIHF